MNWDDLRGFLRRLVNMASISWEFGGAAEDWW